MPRHAMQIDQTEKPSAKSASAKPAPRVISLRQLEQPLNAETDYRVERPRREAWSALFEFHDDE